MRSFAERNPLAVGTVGVTLTAVVMLAALQYDKLPLLSSGDRYEAYFAEAGGLTSGSTVQVSGLKVGTVTGVELDGTQVLVTFTVDQSVRIGDRTEAEVKTTSVLGAKVLEVTPRGHGPQTGPIPVDRTTPPYELPDALGELSTTISDLDTGRLSDSLAIMADTFAESPPHLEAALRGVARFARILDQRDAQLRKLLSDAADVVGVLSKRSDQVAGLIAETNDLLVALHGQSRSLDELSSNVSAASRQLRDFIAVNRDTFTPAVDKLNGVLAIIANRKERVQKTIGLLSDYAMSFGEAVSSGPFFKAYVANLFPGQFVQPFVDAAFSDLGLDPSVLLPSQLTEPSTGQPATPALPSPYPRTGQGGELNLTLPEAITGVAGDPRYPYREPFAAPPPGGSPPGPPASVGDEP